MNIEDYGYYWKVIMLNRELIPEYVICKNLTGVESQYIYKSLEICPIYNGKGLGKFYKTFDSYQLKGNFKEVITKRFKSDPDLNLPDFMFE